MESEAKKTLGNCSFKMAAPAVYGLMSVHTYIHTYTLLMLPKWTFQLNRKCVFIMIRCCPPSQPYSGVMHV